MLDTAKPLLFGGRDESTVDNDCCRRVAVKRIQTENDQGRFLSLREAVALMLIKFRVDHQSVPECLKKVENEARSAIQNPQ